MMMLGELYIDIHCYLILTWSAMRSSWGCFWDFPIHFGKLPLN